jgi:protein tyrosine/serine phosphatase
LKHLRKRLFGRFLPDREQFREPALTDSAKKAAWIDFLAVDLAFLRVFWKNRARISPRAWRMNQPFPADIDWAKRQGIRSIVTARHDPRHGGNALEAEACARLGLAFKTFALFSREAPSREALLAAPAFFDALAYPVLFHCKSGADRAGFLSALFLIVAEGRPVREARHQLSLRFLHFRAARTGVLDAVFDAYLAAHPAEDRPFLDWVAEDYQPETLTRAFRARGLIDFLDRIVLRRE